MSFRYLPGRPTCRVLATTPLPATRQESTTNARLYRCGPAAIDFRLSKTLARPSRDHPASHPHHRPTIAAKVSLAQAARKIKQWFRKLENHWRPWTVHQQLSNPFGNRYECINDFQNHLEKNICFFVRKHMFFVRFQNARQWFSKPLGKSLAQKNARFCINDRADKRTNS